MVRPYWSMPEDCIQTFLPEPMILERCLVDWGPPF